MSLDDRITIGTPEGVDVDLQLAGLASRFMAGVTDLIIQLLLVVVLVLVTGAVTGGGPADVAAFLIGAEVSSRSNCACDRSTTVTA